jgi:hypothetical protein
MQIPRAAVAPLSLHQPGRLGVGLVDSRIVHVGGALMVVFLELTRRYLVFLPAVERLSGILSACWASDSLALG